MGAKRLRAGQHAARENILLDEIGALAVTLEQRFVDGDGLHQRASAGFEVAAHAVEIAVPESRPDGFEHFDGNHMVELTMHVAIVAQQELRPGPEAGAGQAPAREIELLRRQGQPGHMHAVVARREFGEPAPAAADLEQALTGARRKTIEDAAVLAFLRLGEAQGLALEQRARIGHRRIEPQAVEVVAEIIVGLDVLSGLFPRVAIEQVTRAIQQIADPRSVDRLFHRGPVAAKQFDQRGGLVGVPAALHPGLGKADVAAPEATFEHVPVLQRDARVQAAARVAERRRKAVGAVDRQHPARQTFEEAEHDAYRIRRGRGRHGRQGNCGTHIEGLG